MSSVYSRLPEAKKPLSTNHEVAKRAQDRELPEINALDHQIAVSSGSTMALETTKIRLQCSKANSPTTLDEIRLQKLCQFDQQENENIFYQSCREILHELSDTVRRILLDFEPENPFEPEAIFLDEFKVKSISRDLRVALELSRSQEARAEQHWKEQWSSSRIWKPTARWL